VESQPGHRGRALAARATSVGALAVVGGPHPMTCATTEFHGSGTSFALSEAEIVWPAILRDAAAGALCDVYGSEHGWEERLAPPVLVPPSRRELARYAVPMLGIYPARGCPYSCNFCSVIKIAGHRVRSQPGETTL